MIVRLTAAVVLALLAVMADGAADTAASPPAHADGAHAAVSPTRANPSPAAPDTIAAQRHEPAAGATPGTRDAHEDAAPPSDAEDDAATSGAGLADVTHTLGPFSLAGRDYTVVTRAKRLPGGTAAAAGGEALTALDIRDPTGTVVHHEAFGYGVEDGEFANACSASAELLHGNMQNALLVDVGCLPSAPQSGSTWEIFAVWDGTFTRLGPPFTTQGELVRFVSGAVTKMGKATSFQSDVLELRVWTGNFHVTVPLMLSWMQRQLAPPRCYEQSGHGMREGGCELQVKVDRVPVDDELTFVRLFAEANEAFGIPKHVVVRRDSNVEFLGASVRVVMSGTDTVEIGVADDPWLHVRIDGREGWIHTEEDFAALGVPQAG